MLLFSRASWNNSARGSVRCFAVATKTKTKHMWGWKQNTVGHFLNHNIGFDPDPELIRTDRCLKCATLWLWIWKRVWKVESRWWGLYDAEQMSKWMKLSVEVEISTNILISYTFEGILSWHIELWCSCGKSGFESGFKFFVLSLFFLFDNSGMWPKIKYIFKMNNVIYKNIN